MIRFFIPSFCSLGDYVIKEDFLWNMSWFIF